jgi:hypothetical protein
MNSRLTTTASSASLPVKRLADWSSMAKGAFSQNPLRACRGNWEIFTAEVKLIVKFGVAAIAIKSVY